MKFDILRDILVQCTHFTDEEIEGSEGLSQVFTATSHPLGWLLQRANEGVYGHLTPIRMAAVKKQNKC